MKIIFIIFFLGVVNSNSITQSKSHSLRFLPNQDLIQEIKQYIEFKQIKAASISTCVGSLLKCSIRFANQEQSTLIQGHFEIVSLVGTLSVYGYHVHISVGNENGQLIGGHLSFNNNQCIIYTTVEIVLLEHIDTIYTRKIDNTYGYEELYII